MNRGSEREGEFPKGIERAALGCTLPFAKLLQTANGEPPWGILEGISQGMVVFWEAELR